MPETINIKVSEVGAQEWGPDVSPAILSRIARNLGTAALALARRLYPGEEAKLERTNDYVKTPLYGSPYDRVREINGLLDNHVQSHGLREEHFDPEAWLDTHVKPIT